LKRTLLVLLIPVLLAGNLRAQVGTVPDSTFPTFRATLNVRLSDAASISGAYSDPTWITGLAASKLTGSVPGGNGGTGQTTYTIGDLLYASGSSSLAKLLGVATGNVLLSGGVATAPAWGKVNLTTHITGNLPVTNLNSGSGATSGTFWRGDGTWASVTPLAPIYTGTFTGTSLTVTAATHGQGIHPFILVYDSTGYLVSVPSYCKTSGGSTIACADSTSFGDIVIPAVTSGTYSYGIYGMNAPGSAATIAVGSVTTGAPGSSVAITNAGTSSAAVFNFAIPQGATGAQGPAGAVADFIPTLSSSSCVAVTGGKFRYGTNFQNLALGRSRSACKLRPFPRSRPARRPRSTSRARPISSTGRRSTSRFREPEPPVRRSTESSSRPGSVARASASRSTQALAARFRVDLQGQPPGERPSFTRTPPGSSNSTMRPHSGLWP
jgi:hypothetical protein